MRLNQCAPLEVCSEMNSFPRRRGQLTVVRSSMNALREGFALNYNLQPMGREQAADVSATVVIAPNASLSQSQAIGFMVSISTLGLGIALVFSWLGFWLVLPIAGLELTALGVALWWSMRRNGDREVVDVSDASVTVSFGRVGKGPSSTLTWPRLWTRIVLREGPNRLAPTELQLAYGAQRVTIGRCLTDEDRERLARRLVRLVRSNLAASMCHPVTHT